MSSSPRMKLNLNERNPIPNPRGVSEPRHNTERLYFDEVTFGKGRKHFEQHPNFNDNVRFDFKDYYGSPNERIEQLVDYYTHVGQQEKNYNFSPQLYSFYNKEKADPLIKYSKQVRHLNVSPDNTQSKLALIKQVVLLILMNIQL